MSKLNIDQKSVLKLFSESKADFLIPDYQRPYAWDEKECKTLWDDIHTFAFPDDNYQNFDDENDEYFLGPIVTYKNEDGKTEIIDGQQRLTTLMLLLRAFYEKYGNMQDDDSVRTSKYIETCIWKTDVFGRPIKSKLKIDSMVAIEEKKEEFLAILESGKTTDDQTSAYAKNYRYFQKEIDNFLSTYPSYFSYLPIRILNNCILLPIEAESQETALRIFSTLNDRGKPLSDADIFKAQFYKHYSSINQKDYFIQKWKDLEVLCDEIFHPNSGTSMDEIFTRYMYYERAKQGNKSSTTEALRKFYEKDSYDLFKHNQTFENLIDLADFWNDVANQSVERFSDRILRRLFVLNYAPNSMWTYFVSVYYMSNKDCNGLLDDEKFYGFLNTITAFIWAYTITNPGVNALRTPVYSEMMNIVNGRTVTFNDYRFDEHQVRTAIENYSFSNNRAITKSMITWWAFNDDGQELLSLESVFEIEHIFARNRQANERTLKNVKNLEVLGNKALLEKRINIRAADYRFSDKIKYYTGFENNRGQRKDGTKVQELLNLSASCDDFAEKDIEARNKRIIDGFMEYLNANNLLKCEVTVE